jgi:adenine phosphoribosyltransferase
MKVYDLEVAGLKRQLPICKINDSLSFAAFIIIGDAELTEKCATELLKLAPDHDVILTAEAKGIPLAHEMARQENLPRYIVARKGAKLYMSEVFKVEVNSISTEKTQTLFLDKKDANYLRDKRILIVDDVISTGESLHALRKLVDVVGGTIVGQMAILAEGDAVKRDDIVFLQELPLF